MTSAPARCRCGRGPRLGAAIRRSRPCLAWRASSSSASWPSRCTGPDARGRATVGRGDGGSGADGAVDAGGARPPWIGRVDAGGPKVFILSTPLDSDTVAGTTVTLAALQVPVGGTVVSQPTEIRIANAAPCATLDLVENVGSKTERVAGARGPRRRHRRRGRGRVPGDGAGRGGHPAPRARRSRRRPRGRCRASRSVPWWR